MAFIKGDGGDNTLTGGEGDDHFSGLAGNDLLVGNGGDDRLQGDTGSDTLLGGDGDDLLKGGTLASSLDGGAGRDRITAQASGDTVLAGDGDDRVFAHGGAGGWFQGGEGHDDLTYVWSSDEAFVGTLDLKGGADIVLDGATVGGFESGEVVFGAGDDVVTLAKGTHLGLLGGAGNDRLTGNGLNNYFESGVGADTIVAGAGNDSMRVNGDSFAYGGSGNDSMRVEGHSYAEGGSGDDIFYVGGNSTVLGGAGDDTMVGMGIGDLALSGGGGSDRMSGHDGADTLKGGEDADTLAGGLGADLLEGGAGQDLYIFSSVTGSTPDAPDQIRDADFGVVSLEAVDAIKGRAANEAFTLVDHLTGQAGQLTIAYSKADGMTHVEGDWDGDGQADMVILIEGKHVDPNDYIL